GTELRAIRKRLGLSQAKLAALVGVQSNSLARWERGELGIRESAARLIRLLGEMLLVRDPRVSEGRAARGRHAVERGRDPEVDPPGSNAARRALLPTQRTAYAAVLQVASDRRADRGRGRDRHREKQRKR